MAIPVCPKCGSRNNSSEQQGFDLNKAAAGRMVLGPKGTLFGLDGSNDLIYACHQCHTKWMIDENGKIIIRNDFGSTLSYPVAQGSSEGIDDQLANLFAKGCLWFWVIGIGLVLGFFIIIGILGVAKAILGFLFSSTGIILILLTLIGILIFILVKELSKN